MTERSISLCGDDIEIRFPFNKDLNELMAQKGARGQKVRGEFVWVLPVDDEASDFVEILGEHYGFAVV